MSVYNFKINNIPYKIKIDILCNFCFFDYIINHNNFKHEDTNIEYEIKNDLVKYVLSNEEYNKCLEYKDLVQVIKFAEFLIPKNIDYVAKNMARYYRHNDLNILRIFKEDISKIMSDRIIDNYLNIYVFKFIKKEFKYIIKFNCCNEIRNKLIKIFLDNMQKKYNYYLEEDYMSHGETDYIIQVGQFKELKYENQYNIDKKCTDYTDKNGYDFDDWWRYESMLEKTYYASIENYFNFFGLINVSINKKGCSDPDDYCTDGPSYYKVKIECKDLKIEYNQRLTKNSNLILFMNDFIFNYYTN